MKFKNKNSLIHISNFNILELQGLMKLNGEFILVNANDEDIKIKSIDKFGIYKTNDGDLTYDDIVNNYVEGVGVKEIILTSAEFRKLEPLILILSKIRKTFISNATYLDYYNDIFIICYHPFSDGGSNKLIYFEDNNTFMFFDENGPNIKTETKTSTFLDAVS